MLWLARYFPGLNLSLADVDCLTPEETDAMRVAGNKILKGEIDERFAHTKILAIASGARLR